jgi:polyadenylate-binding protein
MTPERRRTILTGELGKRVREMPDVPRDKVDGVVQALVGLDLGVMDALRDRALFGQKVGMSFLFLHTQSKPTDTSSGMSAE